MPYITINGARYHYTDTGKGQETLVLAHGFLMDAEMFRHQIRYFQNRYRIVAFDWRGQGKSEVTAGGYEMDELYEDALALLKTLDMKNPHWVGVSMGGFIGMRLAARNPGLLRSVTLAETSDEAETFIKKMRWGLLAYIFRYFGAGPITGGIQKALFGKHSLENPDFKPVLDEYAAKWKKLDRLATYRIAWAIFNRLPVTKELSSIRIPAMVVVGEQDIARPLDEARRLAGRIPQAQLQIIPQAGHSSPIEQPEAFNRALEGFLERV